MKPVEGPWPLAVLEVHLDNREIAQLDRAAKKLGLDLDTFIRKILVSHLTIIEDNTDTSAATPRETKRKTLVRAR